MSISKWLEAQGMVQVSLNLSDVEQAELTQCESIIERNLAVFYETGQALLKIRDARLYRATHSTFEDYCRERWGFARRVAYRYIEAAEVIDNVSHGTHCVPSNERQARELVGLNAERQREVWREAVETAPNGKVTAAHIALVRDGAMTEGDDDELEEEWDDSPEAEFVRDTQEAYAANRTGFNVALPDPVSYGLEPDTEIEWDAPKPHVSNNSGNNEWYTPPQYLNAAREVLGVIDLDPASSAFANTNVKAAKFYAADDDGLEKDWTGRVWMNPPYSSDLVGRFASKLCRHVAAGDVSEAIVLVNNATETQWFQEMAGAASAVCFPKGRIKYLDSTGTPANTPLQGQAFLYFGDRPTSFIEVFQKFGCCMFV